MAFPARSRRRNARLAFGTSGPPIPLPPIEKRTRMRFPRRQFLRLAGAAVALPAVARIARAQAYPSRQIRLIIGYPPGGSADITARLIAQWLTERLGQSVIVEGRPGGGTHIATEAGVKAPPGGLTPPVGAPAEGPNPPP